MSLKVGRIFKAVASGGLSEAQRALKKKRTVSASASPRTGGRFFKEHGTHRKDLKHFDELREVENFAPDKSNSMYSHNNIHDRSIESFLGQPVIKDRMTQYVRMHGYEPSTDPKTLAGQIVFIKDELKKKYAKQRMKSFVSKQDWDRYVQSGEFDRDAEAGVEELERQSGFVGFDDQETEKFLPLIAGAVGMIAKNKKVQGLIKKVGGKVASAVSKKKAQTNAIIEQDKKAKGAHLKAKALKAGVPAEVIAQIQKPEVLAEVTKVHEESEKPAIRTKDDKKTMYIIGGIIAVIVLIVILKK